jgi:hypothetical protein
VISSLLVVIPVALWTTADPVVVVKWTLFMAGGLALAGLLVVRHLTTGQTVLYERRALFPLGLFLAAVLVVAATSESGWLALIGEYSYYQGVLTFIALVVVLLAVLSVPDDPTITVMRATTLGAGLVALLTAGQFVGIEWFGYEPRMFGRVVTTLGNSNFGAAFLALTLPAILHQVFFGSRSGVERWLSAGVALLVALEAVVIGSVQGPITAVLAVVAWSTLVGIAKAGPRRALGGLAGFSVVAALGVVALWSRVYAEISDSFRAGRQGAWVSAWEQFKEHPLLGVGLDHFGENYTAYRPAFSAARAGERFTDAGQAHNVVLDLLADGGLLLGGTYVALVLYTGYRGVRGLRCLHTAGDQRRYLKLAGAFSVWLAYQAQAQVSIDHVPLALVHWVFMALILRISHTADGREPVAVGERRRRGSPSTAALAGVGGVCLVLFWFALIPLRADLAAGSTERLEQSGRPAEAIEQLEHATSLMPFRPFYWIQLGLRVQSLHGAVAAAPYMERGARLDESNAHVAMLLGQYYVAAGDEDAAARWFEEAVDRDPHNPEVLDEAASFHDDVGRDDRAADLRRRLDTLPPAPDA